MNEEEAYAPRTAVDACVGDLDLGDHWLEEEDK